MAQKPICGIYKITSPSGKIYIGQSKDIERRIAEYARNKNYEQGRIYHSILKYGFEVHIFETLFTCEPEELDVWEIFYVDVYNTFKTENGLNLTPGGSTYASVLHTTPRELRPVYVKYSNGEIVKYESAFECEEALTIGLQSIRRYCRVARIYKGCYFSYALDFDKEFKKENTRSDGRVVYVKDTLGSIKKYRCIQDCGREIKVNMTSIARNIRTGRLYKKLYYFSDDPDFPPTFDLKNKVSKIVYAKDLEGIVTKHPSIVSCAEKLGISADTVTQSIKGDRWSRKGYYFSHNLIH